MSDQHPSVEDEVERALRLGLATASQIADRYARARQDLVRQAQHRSEQEARQLEARYRAEGASATARLAVADRTEWWDRATPADITSMWQLAVQWQDEQPRAAIAAETIERQVQERYGLDVRAAAVDAEAVRAAVARADAEQRDRAGRPYDHGDAATAVAAVLRAEQRDAALAPPAEEHQQMGAVQAETDVDGAVSLELKADQDDGQAVDGRTVARTAVQLGDLPRDARAEASRPRVEAEATPPHGGSYAALAYDSIERREHTAATLRETGLSPESVAVALRADIAHARPAADAVTSRATTSRSRGIRRAARGTQPPERSR